MVEAARRRNALANMGEAMRAALLLIACTLSFAACNKGPQINEKNASVEVVANKVQAAAGDQGFVDPGRWETKVSVLDVDIPGMPPQMAAQMKKTMGKMQENTFDSCLTEEDVKRPKEDFFAGKNKDCRYDRFTMADGKIDAALRCDGKPEGGAMTMTINGSYSRDSYEATMAMDVAGGREGGMKIRSHSESHRVGQCKGDEINAKDGGQG
jgi:hypothetical protein